MRYFIPLEILPNKNILTRVPILYITGDDDKYLHVDGHRVVFDQLYSAAPRDALIELKIINQCGHLPQDEKPQEVLESVVNFLFRVGL
jgi:pimeloyl-ACP methyl ester carboxylesterase